MTGQKCWICNTHDANSGEHIVKRSVLKKILGDISRSGSRYINYFGGDKNIQVKGYKNPRFKFKKSICSHCNGALSQPYDDAFSAFIDGLFRCKSLIITRNKINLPSLCGSSDATDKFGLYVLKVFGCLLLEHELKIEERDFQLIRNSLLSGQVYTDNIYIAFHRDLKKLAAKRGKLVGQLPVFSDDFLSWTIDLDWISILISYPVYASPEKKYGAVWNLRGDAAGVLDIGKLQ